MHTPNLEKSWLDLFIEEKHIEADVLVEVDTCTTSAEISFHLLRTLILTLDDEVQEQIKQRLLAIDQADGNIMLFFRYIAQEIFIQQSHGYGPLPADSLLIQ